jgi:NitT/TauT family transport system permease protein
LGGVLLLLVIWQLLSLFSGTKFLLPPPRDVFVRFGQLFSEKEGWLAVIQSGERILQGVFLSAMVALFLAFVAWRVKIMQRLIAPFVLLMKTVPIVSFILIALFFLGNQVLTIFICGLVVFPMVYESVLAALSGVSHELLEMAHVFCFKKRDTLRFIIVPACRDPFLAAMSVAIGMAWKAGVASEVLSLAKPSIGWHLHDSRLYLDMEGLLAWTLAIVLLSFISEKLIILVLRRALSYVGRKLPEKTRRTSRSTAKKSPDDIEHKLCADVEKKPASLEMTKGAIDVSNHVLSSDQAVALSDDMALKATRRDPSKHTNGTGHSTAITIDDEQRAPQISDFLSETSHSVTITIDGAGECQKHQERSDGMGHSAAITIDDKQCAPQISDFSSETNHSVTISIKGLDKAFGETVLFRNLSVELPLDRPLIVNGASGSGKTTLLRMLASLEHPDAGVISGVPANGRFVFQENLLIPQLSARDNVRVVLPDYDGDRADALLQQLDLSDVSDQPAALLSGGEKRRVAIARAIAPKSGILFLDEPLRELDEKRETDAICLILDAFIHVPVILAAHDARLIDKLNARVLTLVRYQNQVSNEDETA